MTLTAVAGLTVGHATHPDGGTGCTVVVGPFRAAVQVDGLATGSRELDALSPNHLVEETHAILLTGGSAYGLAAADGVMGWLEEQGIGFATGGQIVPIVPAAVIFDLQPGRARPDAELGRAACQAATDAPVAMGPVGAGAGATVGKMAGIPNASAGGVGSASLEVAGFTVAALSVVNAVGDVLAADGSILAGAKGPDGAFLDSAALLLGSGPPVEPSAGTNTVTSVVATDAPLDRKDLGRVARMASTALARRISPANTLYDGDTTFAVSTAPESRPFEPMELVTLGNGLRVALERAIEAAVTA